MTVKLKRIYDKGSDSDGLRVLVDRVWPRGVSKEKANVDHWLKKIGPTSDLRKWFQHDPEKFPKFKEKYKEELNSGEQKEELEKLKELADNEQKLTLLFGAKDETNNQAAVLKEVIEKDSNK